MKKILLILAVVVIAACNKKPEHPANTAPQYFTHTIASQGETLANIAKWYTGAASNWQPILAYNPGLDVKRMRIGTQINIPNNMLVRTAVMPKNKSSGTAVAKQPQDVEIIQPAQDSLANTQTETTTAVTEEFPANNGATNDPNTTTVTNADGEEVVIKQLTPEEIAAINGESNGQVIPEGETADSPQKKSILSKFQEAAMKAQEKTLNENGQAVPPSAPPVVPAVPPVDNNANQQIDAANAQIQAAQEQAKAAQEAANAQIKAAQEQSAKAMADAQKQGADAQQNSAKTRDDLIKELTQDY